MVFPQSKFQSWDRKEVCELGLYQRSLNSGECLRGWCIIMRMGGVVRARRWEPQ